MRLVRAETQGPVKDSNPIGSGQAAPMILMILLYYVSILGLAP